MPRPSAVATIYTQKHEAFRLCTALCVVCVHGPSLDHRLSRKPAWLRLEFVSDR